MNWPKPVKNIAFNILWFIGYVLRKLYLHVNIEGLENVPRKGSYLLVGNHQSYFDPVVLHLVSPRRLNFLMAAEYYNNWRWKWFYDVFGCIPLEKGRANPKAVERAMKVILEGEPLVMFPEGGISIDGRIGKWQPGVGMVALRTGVPVIPVIIKGTRDALPIGRYILRSKPVEVYAGKPIVFKQREGPISRDEINEATHRIRQAFLQLAREKGLYEEIVGPMETLPGS